MKKLSLLLIAFTMVLVSCKPEIEKPTVVTKSVEEVTVTSAKVVGQVTADGGAEVAERGICWSTDGTPTILDYRVKDVEGGLGSYDIVFTDLVPNTQYYVRAYAANETGTGYGDEKTFTTLEVTPDEPGDEPDEPGDDPETPEQPEENTPIVTTAEVTDITTNSAICGGNVTSDGNATVIARGVCWSTNHNPTIEDNMTTNGSGLGSFTTNMTNLEYNTTYYVRAYATNEVGTAYGEERNFTTLPIGGTSNGHDYVDLGLPSGLKWATCNVGATSPEEYGDYFSWGETYTKETYEGDNCITFGIEMNDISGNIQYDAARANWGGDWRMPTSDELSELYVECIWTWTTQNGINGYKVEGPNGANIFLPAAGYRIGESLDYAGSYGYYWGSTPYMPYNSCASVLHFDDYRCYVSIQSRFNGQSVRPVLE